MKTVTNKTHGPLKVPLPRGKSLRLGPLQSGQISHNDVDHEPLQRLVEGGDLEVLDDKSNAHLEHEHGKGPRASTQGHHPATAARSTGDR